MTGHDGRRPRGRSGNALYGPPLDDRPKVLAPVAGRPFLTYLLDMLRGFRSTGRPVDGL